MTKLIKALLLGVFWFPVLQAGSAREALDEARFDTKYACQKFVSEAKEFAAQVNCEDHPMMNLCLMANPAVTVACEKNTE